MTVRHSGSSLGPFTIDRIYQKDAIIGLRALADASVDLIVTDPPYNIASPHKTTLRRGKIISTQEAWGSWDSYHPFDYDILILQLISQSYRVLKPGGSLYLFTAREQNGYFVRRAVERGFTYRNQLALVKKNPLPSFAKTNWRSGFELCMYLTKGKPGTFNFLSQKDCVNTYPHANGKKYTTHPTEKPLELIKRLVAVSSQPGELVLDPFIGSGTTAVAAKELRRRFLGFDLSKEYVDMARARARNVGKMAS